MELIYDTTLTASECFVRLLNPHLTAEDEFNPANAEFTQISDSRVYLVYKGRRFGKYRRSEFTMDFSVSDLVSMRTKITITFNRELFGCPFPMTSDQEMDSLLKEKILAYRRK